MMVDGPDSMETHVHLEGSDEVNSGVVIQRDEDTPQQITSPTTTTISTIAVQSGETRVVIALLQVRNMHLNNNLYFLLSRSCSVNASNNFISNYFIWKFCKKKYLKVFPGAKQFNFCSIQVIFSRRIIFRFHMTLWCRYFGIRLLRSIVISEFSRNRKRFRYPLSKTSLPKFHEG